jgi:hypothetical protein
VIFWSFTGLAASAVILTGCLGGEITGRRPERQVAFPSLQSVPERPPKEDLAPIQQSIEAQAQEQQGSMAFNQELRRHFGLLSSGKQVKTKAQAEPLTTAPPAL